MSYCEERLDFFIDLEDLSTKIPSSGASAKKQESDESDIHTILQEELEEREESVVSNEKLDYRQILFGKLKGRSTGLRLAKPKQYITTN